MQDKKLLKDNEELDIADVTEYARYSMEIERTFAELQKGLAVCYDPKEIALNAMCILRRSTAAGAVTNGRRAVLAVG